MAKISELVKTYKLLNDPNSPDWNVRFVGGAVIALAVVAAAGAFLWTSGNAGEDVSAPAAIAEADAEAGAEEAPCQTALPDGAAQPAGPLPEAGPTPCVPTLP